MHYFTKYCSNSLSSIVQGAPWGVDAECDGDGAEPQSPGGDPEIHLGDPHLGRPKRQLRL